MSSTGPEVMKWFTRARRFPQLIGRTPDGARIPGGPYTVTQVVGAGAVLFLGTRTMSLWAHYGLLTNAVILLSVAVAVVFGLGKIPVGSRNPLSVSAGALRALSAPPTGRVAGRPVRLRRPHQVRHQLVMLRSTPPAPGPSADADTPSAAPVLEQPGGGLRRKAPVAPRGGRRRPARAPAVTAERARTAAAAPARAATARVPAAGAAPVPASSAPPQQRAVPALTGLQALLARTAPSPPRTAPTATPPPASPSRLKDR